MMTILGQPAGGVGVHSGRTRGGRVAWEGGGGAMGWSRARGEGEGSPPPTRVSSSVWLGLDGGLLKWIVSFWAILSASCWDCDGPSTRIELVSMWWAGVDVAVGFSLKTSMGVLLGARVRSRVVCDAGRCPRVASGAGRLPKRSVRVPLGSLARSQSVSAALFNGLAGL